MLRNNISIKEYVAQDLKNIKPRIGSCARRLTAKHTTNQFYVSGKKSSLVSTTAKKYILNKYLGSVITVHGQKLTGKNKKEKKKIR